MYVCDTLLCIVELINSPVVEATGVAATITTDVL